MHLISALIKCLIPDAAGRGVRGQRRSKRQVIITLYRIIIRMQLVMNQVNNIIDIKTGLIASHRLGSPGPSG